MEAPTYVTLSRQSGLMNEMRVLANNIANASTTGFRQEGLLFSEFVRTAPGQPSLSMSRGQVRNTSQEQGTLNQTGGNLDFAIEGDGYFLVQSPKGQRLTRAGSFTTNSSGDLVTSTGYPVLDAGGAPLFVPPGSTISVAKDGTISASGQPLGQVGLFTPTDRNDLAREDGVMFKTDSEILPVENPKILQGFLENSNVNALLQVARMLEVQRTYEMGQSFSEAEDQRIRNAIRTLIRT